MSIYKYVFRIWVALTLLSICVDIACFWLVQHTPAAVPGSDGYNFITIFLLSAPAPIVLAPVLLFLGMFWGLLSWVWKTLRLAQRVAVPRSELVPSNPVLPVSEAQDQVFLDVAALRESHRRDGCQDCDWGEDRGQDELVRSYGVRERRFARTLVRIPNRRRLYKLGNEELRVISFNRVMGYTLALALTGATAQAQSVYPPPPAPVGVPPSAAPALYAAPQLDQMLAAIALYPDPLLTEILTAATYPYEVDEAARWLQVPANAALRDGPLGVVLAGIDWDPSVKSLVPFPQILRMMDDHLDWTQALGNAFLAQQADVMDSIQRLRHEALAAGTLASGLYQTVTVDGPYIEIEPAQPQSVYVPVYNPVTIYGPWPYPAYPPYYFGPPPGLSASFFIGGIGFSIGIGIVDVLWHWSDWDWRDHDIHVDRDRFNRINAGRPPIAATTWQHDPNHRRGVPYRDARSREAYQPKVPGPPEQRQQFRFYGTPQQQANVPPGQPRQRAAPPAQPAPVQRTQQQPQARPAAPLQQQERAAPQTPPQRSASVSQPQRAQAPPGRSVAPGAAPARGTRPAQPTARATPQGPTTAFQRGAPGPQAHAEARRGEQSRQSPSAPAPQLRPVAPVARPAPQQAPQRPAPPQQGGPQQGSGQKGERRQ